MPELEKVRFDGKLKVKIERGGDPVEPAPDEALVRVESCGICGTDLRQFEGRWPQPEYTPGHEFVGTVIRAGSSVGEVGEGDRVTAALVESCGECALCEQQRTNLCRTGGVLTESRDGAMATHVTVPAGMLHRIPDGIASDEGVLLEPLSVAVHGLRMCEETEGRTIAVCGAGTLGLLFVQAAAVLGASRVVCTARHPFQRDLAESLGADTAVNAQELPDDLAGSVDIAVDCVGGRGEGLSQAMTLVRPGGTIVAVGGYQGLAGVDMWKLVRNELQLRGAFCYSIRDGMHDMKMAIGMAAEGKVNLGRLVTHRYPLSEAQEAFETALDKTSRESVKVVLACGEAV
ncbi:zinc-binding dehydrogenase [Planctomycetota bacterium]